ncbi:MAG: molybdopterin molybdotransferase MoeA [Deltaproteobacteria bacterium]|nr:molybdopterin molybdotransferase MoeA [Deltaproteobacteria bacterium]
MTEYKRKGVDYLNPEKFATRAEIVQRVLGLWAPKPGTEVVPLAEAAWRVSAETLASTLNQPFFRASFCDGIAVRSADFLNGPPETSAWKEGIDYVPADMGDDFDDAFDMVVNIEKVSFDENGAIVIEPEPEAKSGLRIRTKGETLREGETAITAGAFIDPFKLGFLAGAGVNEISVLTKPKVAFIPTGTELIPPGQAPKRGQTVESNGLMVGATLGLWRADFKPFPIVVDQKEALEKTLNEALASCDIVLLNGGTSMGSEDLVSSALARKGSFFQHGVKAVPGLPMAVALIDGKPVVNVPGPPFAAFCGMDWLVKPLVAHWSGQPCPQRRKVLAKLTKEITKPGHFEFFHRLRLFKDESANYMVDPISFFDRYAEATGRFNAIYIVPIGIERIEAGEEIEAEVLYSEWANV